MQRVLIIEDERDIADLIGFNLERAGYEVTKAYDGIDGASMALHQCPDLVILDLMLTARAQTEDRIKGLEAGADDYLTKPFSPKELMLRVQAVLKRSESAPGSVAFEHGPFRFDKNDLKFYLQGEPVELTSTEFKLLAFLSERAGKPQDRNDLLRTVWGYSDDVHSRTLDTHMKRLRQKLGEHAAMVETVRGIGYCVSSL